MRVCLTCYTASAGAPPFCGSCGRSFGGRICPRRHLSPRAAQFCVQCGRTDLSEPTGYVGLGWLPILLSLLCIFLLSRWAWIQAAPVVGGVAAQGITHLVRWVIMIAVVLALLPGRFGGRVRYQAGRFVTRTGRSLWRLVIYGIGYKLLREGLRELRRRSGPHSRGGP